MLFTFGGFLVLALIDAFLIPGMVRARNAELRAKMMVELKQAGIDSVH